MKKFLFLALAFLLLMGAFAFKTIRHYQDIFRQLGVQEQTAKEYIFSSFEQGTLSFPSTSMMKKLALGQREAAVKEIGDYIKAYTATPSFEQQYLAAREEAKPKGVESPEDKIKAKIETLEHDLETTKEDMKETTGDMRKLYEETLKQITRQLKALKDPKDPMHRDAVEDATEVSEQESQFASEDLKYWEEAYPASVKELIRRRLVNFLEFTADMNFNAQLVKKGNRMYFADPSLEEKDGTWKYCFRAGKETITAARAYAKQWLATLK